MVRRYACFTCRCETRAYRALDVIEAGPRHSFLVTSSAPCSKSVEATVCRRLWQRAVTPAALA